MKTLAGILAAVLLCFVTLAYADDCGVDCTGSGWTLYIGGDQISWPEGELTEEQCNEMAQELEPQAPPFTPIECKETPVKRESI